MNEDERARSLSLAADKLTDAIKPILAGKSPITVGAALADLLALWLASHIVTGGHEAAGATEELRRRLLEMHIEAVKSLVPVNHAAIHGSNNKETLQ